MKTLKRTTLVSCWITILILLFIVTYQAVAQEKNQRHDEIKLGLRTPISPFMWRNGRDMKDVRNLQEDKRKQWTFLQANLDHSLEWGGRWNIVVVRQWMDTQDNFARLHRIVDEHEQRGLEVVFRLIEDPVVYERLIKTESIEFGFDKDYYDWVTTLANGFGSRVKCFLIGNESELDQGPHFKMWIPDAPDHVLLPYDRYAKLLKTAVKAIKSVDSRIQVANCGFSDFSLILALAIKSYEAGDLDGAFQYWSDWRGTGGIQIGGKQNLLKMINDPESKRKIKFLRQAIHEPMGSDLFQIHYYGSWRALQPILDWIRKEMQASHVERPIIATEVGYRIRMNKSTIGGGKKRLEQDYNFYSEDEHAQNTVKSFSILLGNDIKMALYWQMRANNNYGQAVRLFKPTEDPFEFNTTRASRAFRMLGNTLNGSRLGPPILPPTAGLKEFHFIGGRDVSIIWSDSEDVIPKISGVAEITDLEGNLITDSQKTKLKSEPVYVFWPSGKTSTIQKPERFRVKTPRAML